MNGKSDRIRRAAAIVLLLAAAFFGYRLIAYRQASQSAKIAFDALATQFHGGVREGGLALSADMQPSEGAGEEPDPIQALLALQAQNPDTFAWLEVGGTQIDYPVMHTPKNAEYYLRRNFQQEYSISGTPFLDARCTADSDNHLIYGHNMQSGAMFADLLQYRDPAYFETNNTIKLHLAEGTRTYQVIAAFPTEVGANQSDFLWYSSITFSSGAQFQEYVAQVARSSLHALPVTPRYGDRFVTLATCSYHDESGRFVLVGLEVETPPVSE